MKLRTKNIAIYSILVSIALGLSFLEAQIPLPLPGVKLGLSNIITLFALYTLGIIPAGIILFCRCILSSLFGGGISSLLFSLCGGFFAIVSMAIIRKVKFFTVYGVSIFGAAAHGIGQIIAACILFHSFSAIFYLPVLLFSSLITGSLIAYLTQIIISRLNMFKS